MPQSRARKRIRLDGCFPLRDLPREVLVMVAGQLDQEDALSMLYSAKMFGHAARHRLYRKIVICEKPQDQYFFDLSLRYKFTLLASWESIIKFFRYFHANRDSEAYQYIEELSSYNYLDHGTKADKFKNTSVNDLDKLLVIRQCWETVIGQCKNLKKFIFPKLPIERIMFLPDDIKENLVEISINLDDEQSNGLVDFGFPVDRMFKFPSLQKLSLNLDHKSAIYPIMTDIVIHILNFQNGVNNQLIELELNGSFGQLDRDMEHLIRHVSFDGEFGFKASFVAGYHVGEQTLGLKKSIRHVVGNRRIKRVPISDLETFEDKEEYHDGSLHKLINNSPHIDEIDGVDSEDLDDDYYEFPRISGLHKTEELEPALSVVNFNKPEISNYPFSYTELEFVRIIIEMINNYTFTKLDKLSFVNCRFDNSPQMINSFIIKNEKQIEEINFINCYMFSPQEGLINASPIYHVKSLENLKSFTFSFTPVDLTLIENDFGTNVVNFLERRENGVLRITKALRPMIIETENLIFNNFIGVLLSCQKLENLNVQITSSTVKLENFLSLFKQAKLLGYSGNMKTIKYVNRLDIFIIIRKLVHVKIFKKFNHFNNLNLIDEFQFGLYKRLIEFFNSICRIDNYDLNRFQISPNNSKNQISFFIDEFKYLFKDEVKPFFKILPNLQKFEYFGFTFTREDV